MVWQLPEPIHAIGPGCFIGVQSQVQGPPQFGFHWQIQIWTTDGSEKRIGTQDVPRNSQHLTMRLFDPMDTINWGFGTEGETVAENATVRLEAFLYDGSTLIDSDTTDVPWITVPFQTQWQAIWQEWVREQMPTETDRTNWQLAVDNTTVDMLATAPPPDLHNVPVGRLPGAPALIWNERVGPFVLTGRGAVDLSPTANRGLWMAMRWFFTVIPPGWGMTPGAIDEFDNRPAQLVPVYVLESGEEVGEPVIDANTSGGYYQFHQGPGVNRIEYQIAPGWTVTLFTYRIIGSG